MKKLPYHSTRQKCILRDDTVLEQPLPINVNVHDVVKKKKHSLLK